MRRIQNPVLRILLGAVLFSLIFGAVVVGIGLLLKWKTSTQFSDGFFLAGMLMIGIGLVTAMGRSRQGVGSYSQTVPSMNGDERFMSWVDDTLRTYNALAFLGLSGLLLFGMSGLALLFGK
jgi:hypothetical protein